MVDCVIVGVARPSSAPKRLFDGDVVSSVEQINAYLVPGPLLYIGQQRRSLFGLPQMIYGAMPNDDGALILTREERDAIVAACPEAARFLRPLYGTTEILNGAPRFCIWIEDAERQEALRIPPIRARVERCRAVRLASPNDDTVEMADRAHRFWHVYPLPASHSIMIPSASSERREVLPVDRLPAEAVATNLCQLIPDGPDWTLALIASRLHLVWIGTVCGKLQARYRYSSQLGWHNFPAPALTDAQKRALDESARAILRVRYEHYPATIEELYDPDKMPDDIRAVHRANDERVEEMYIGRPFRTDTERLEYLFRLYAARVRKLKKEAA